MDLGCLDLGCISVTNHTESKGNDSCESVTATSKIGKTKSLKETGQSALNSLNKFTSQIKKPSHRKSSPLNWFPRKKVDSYLERKIKMLQEVDGMNLTLDETLGDSNPHYSRVLREKMAAKEAAYKVMEAQKAALVEASWCRILKASRIQCKEAEAQLVKAEKTAAEAFEAARAIGVIMYDKPNCPRKPCHVESSSMNRGSTSHAVTASFQSAFEVDKEVAAAVRTALIRLSNCSSFNKDEFKALLRKISQNPDAGEKNQELSEFVSSECESESGSELETVFQKDGSTSQDLDCKMPASEVRQRKNRRRQSFEKLNMTKLVDMMLERLRCLHEDELSSLATIVATCGLNAALAEVENSKLHDRGSTFDPTCKSSLDFPQGAGKLECSKDGQMRRKQTEPELPSLDKFLVKHMTKLERELQEARNSRRNECNDETAEEKVNLGNNETPSESIPELGSILLKHSSKLEKEIEEAKKNFGKNLEGAPNGSAVSHMKKDVTEIPSLDKLLVKHVSRLEKEVEEARNRRKNDPHEETNMEKEVNPPASEKNSSSCSDEGRIKGKENVDLNKKGEINAKETEDSLDKILVKPVHKLEREKMHASALGNNYGYKKLQKNQGGGDTATECESLDKVLVKHVSRLEKEKMSQGSEEESVKVNRKNANMHMETNETGGLDQILVKHKSRLEREKLQTAQQPEDQMKHSVTLREARERELQEAWGGLSLGNSMKPHLSKLERDKVKMQGSEEESVKVNRKNANMHMETTETGGLDQSLVKHKSRLEREKLQTAQQPEDQMKHSVTLREARERELQEAWGGLSLGNSMKPHLSKLERDKVKMQGSEEESVKVNRKNANMHMETNETGGLDQILVKHKSRLEREKLFAAQQPEDQMKHFVTLREARERKLQEAWGGLSLGNSMKPHLSKLERDKAAWIKAENEERSQAMGLSD